MGTAAASPYKRSLVRSLALSCLLLAGGCSIEPGAPGDFYKYDDAVLSAAPGDILRVEDFPGAPQGARAWRVLYRSTGLSGEPIAVSGVILAPEGESGGPRPVVAWAHGTTGVASRCAPSLRSDYFFKNTPGLKQLLDRGYVVAATDYPGLGTASPHPYLVGISEGRAVLDSVRAATRIEGANAATEFVAWGHSQGGHAVLFTGQLAPSYAADLTLAGVAAAAPATDIGTLLRDDIQSGPGKVLTAYALWSWNRVYDAPLSPLLDDTALSAVNRIAEDCLEGPLEGLLLARREKAIDHDFLQGELTEIQPWKSILARNSPDAGKLKGPLFIAQGAADQIVTPQVTRTFAEAACQSGTSVTFDWQEGLDHLKILTQSVDTVVEWIAERFAGSAPASNCGEFPPITSTSR